MAFVVVRSFMSWFVFGMLYAWMASKPPSKPKLQKSDMTMNAQPVTDVTDTSQNQLMSDAPPQVLVHTELWFEWS